MQTWKETSPPSPERLDEDLPTSAKPGAAPGRAQPAPLLRRSGPNTKRFGGQSEQLPAAAGAPLNSPAHGACYRRLPEAEEGGGRGRTAGGSHTGCRRQTPAPRQTPGEPGDGAAPPRWFQGAAGQRVPHRRPGSSGRRRPLPGAPRTNKAPRAHRQPLAVLRPRTPVKIQAQGCGPGGNSPPRAAPVTHSAAAPGVPPSPLPWPRPGSLRALGLRLNLQTSSSSSSRPGRGVCGTPLLHAAPAAEPLPQPLPREARPGPGLQLTPLRFSSSSSSPGGWERGEERLTTRTCLWSRAKESSRITAPGRREEKGGGDKRRRRRRKKNNQLLFSRREQAPGFPALSLLPGHRFPAPAGSPIPASPGSPPALLHHHRF